MRNGQKHTHNTSGKSILHRSTSSILHAHAHLLLSYASISFPEPISLRPG